MTDLRLSEAQQMVRTLYHRFISLQSQLDFTMEEIRQYLKSISAQPPEASPPSDSRPGPASTPPGNTMEQYPERGGE